MVVNRCRPDEVVESEGSEVCAHTYHGTDEQKFTAVFLYGKSIYRH